MSRQAGEAVLFRQPREFRECRSVERAGAAYVDIEAVLGGADLDIERLADRLQEFGNGIGCADSAVHRRIENRAMGDRHDLMPTGGREADAQRTRSLPRVKRGAAAAGAARIDQGADLACDARLLQRVHDKLSLPVAIGIGLPMLDRAAAADTEILAEWCDPLRAWSDDLHKITPVRGSFGRGGDLDGFAAERVGHVDIARAIEGDAVALLADMIDGEAFHRHQPRRAPIKNSRLPSPPSIEEGNTSISVQPCAAANAAMSSQIAR